MTRRCCACLLTLNPLPPLVPSPPSGLEAVSFPQARRAAGGPAQQAGGHVGAECRQRGGAGTCGGPAREQGRPEPHDPGEVRRAGRGGGEGDVLPA